MTRILLTTDLSEEAARAYPPTVELAAALGATVEVLHVVEELQSIPHGAPLAPMQPSPETEAARTAAEEKLARVAASIGADVETKLIVASDVADAITDYASQSGADWIAMSTHGRTGWRHLLLGSVAEKVLRHATVPTITFPRKADPH